VTAFRELVQVVDPEWVLEPAVEPQVMEDCTAILLREGWTLDQVGEWGKTVWLYSPAGLRLGLTARKN